jgi:hypothetical protein
MIISQLHGGNLLVFTVLQPYLLALWYGLLQHVLN